MERLTKRSKNSDMVWFNDAENGNAHLEPCEMTAHHNRIVLDKLGAYEDLGYTPEELKLCFNPPERIYEIGDEVDGSRIHTLYPVDAEEIEIICGDVYWNCRDNFGDVAEIPLGGLHEDYFLSFEEAKAKLKEMEEKDGR